MQSRPSKVAHGLVALLCILSVLVLLPSSIPVRGAITACGNIVTAVIWRTTDGTVAVRCNVIVRPSGSLTIEPAVRVEMDPAVAIFVEGSLMAVGTTASPIIVAPPNVASANWNTIQFNGSGTGRVAFASLSHGNRALAANGSSPRFENNAIGTATVGIHLRSSASTVQNNSISDATYGILADLSAARVWFNSVTRARFGVFANGGTSTWIANNTISNTRGPGGPDSSLPGGRGGDGTAAYGILAVGVSTVLVVGNNVTGVVGGRGGAGGTNFGGTGGAGGTGGDAVGIGVGNAMSVTADLNIVAAVRGGRGGNGGGGSANGGAGGNGGNAYPIEFLTTTVGTSVIGNSIDNAVGGPGGDGGPGSGASRDGVGGGGADAVAIFAIGSRNAFVIGNAMTRIEGGMGGNSTITPSASGGGRGGAAAGIFGFGVPGFHDYEFNYIASLVGGDGGRGRAGGSGGDATGVGVVGNAQFVNLTTLVGNFIDVLTGGLGGLATVGTGGAGGSVTGEALVNVDLALSRDSLRTLRGGTGGPSSVVGGTGGGVVAFLGVNVRSGLASTWGVSGATPGSAGSGGTPSAAVATGVYGVGAAASRTAITFVNATIAGVAAGGFDFAVDNYAHITALNASWNPVQLFMAPAGNLTIQNFLHLRAVWPDALTPAAGSRFNVRDNGVLVHNVTADPTGWARWRIVTDRRYIGSTTATENATLASATYPSQTFFSSPRLVDMSTSHVETFMMIDATAPTSALSALPTYTTTVTVSVPFSSSDGPGVGVRNVTLYYSRNGAAWTRHSTVAGAVGTFLFDSSATGGDALYTFTSIAADSAGNVEPGPSANKTWTLIDTTRPGSHVEPLPRYVTSTSFLVRWSPDEGVTDIARYTVQVRDNGGVWVNWLEATTLTMATFTGLDGHTYEFRSLATDRAGNAEVPLPGNDTWTIVDVTLPRSLVAALPVYETTTSFTLSWSASAGTTDIAAFTIEVSDNGGPWTTVVNGTATTSIGFAATDGRRYAFRAIARDRAGNWEAKSGGVNDTWTIVDATPPRITVFAPTGDSVGRSAPIVITFSEPMDATATEANVSFTPTLAGAFSWNANRTVLTFVAYSPLAAQTQYTIVIGSGARDRAGNVLSQRVFQFTTAVALPSGPAIGDFWWVFIILAAAVIGGLFLFLRMRKPGPGPTPAAAATKAEESIIEDVFLLYRDGVLIKHQTRRLKPDIDSDILSGMLTAVQAFVKDSFRGEAEGELDEMKFGEMRIMIGRGRYVILAGIVTGGDTFTMKNQISGCIREIEEKHWDQLEDWNGDLVLARDLDPYVKKLIRGEYR